MKVVYEVTLRSKERNRPGPDWPRDFGGMLPGVMEYTIDSVKIPVKTDAAALRRARKIAREKHSIIMRVTKTWDNWAACHAD